MSTLILITGPSGCGKTTLAQHIANHINTNNNNNNNDHQYVENLLANHVTKAVVLHQDDYFTKPFIPYKDRKDDSYENESGINWMQLQNDIMKGAGKRSATPTSTSKTNSNHPHNSNIVMIVEGHLLSSSLLTIINTTSSNNSTSNYDENNQNTLFNTYTKILILLISCNEEKCLNQRLNRNPNRTKEESNELKSYYSQYVWSSYLKYGIDAKQSFRDWFGMIMMENNQRMNENYLERDRDKVLIIELDKSNDNDMESSLMDSVNMILDAMENMKLKNNNCTMGNTGNQKMFHKK